jgi:hypothetical protein
VHTVCVDLLQKDLIIFHLCYSNIQRSRKKSLKTLKFYADFLLNNFEHTLSFLTVHNAELFYYSVQFCGAQAMPRVRDVCLPWSGQGRRFRRKFFTFFDDPEYSNLFDIMLYEIDSLKNLK